MSVHVNAECAHEMTARERLRSILVERMYQQVVARPAYPKVYSMGISIIKTQVQYMHEKNQKKEIETSHIGLLEILYQSDYCFRRTINTSLYCLNTTICPQVLLPDYE